MEIFERIRFLRKEKLHLTQESLGEPLGMSRANIANIEAGRISVTDRVIHSICDKFNVDENWLRTGEGDIFLKLDKENQLMAWAENILKDESDSFKRRFVSMLMELDESDWEALEKIALKLYGNTHEPSNDIDMTKQTGKGPKKSLKKSFLSDDDIDREVEDYRRQLKLERQAEEKSGVLQKNA